MEVDGDEIEACMKVIEETMGSGYYGFGVVDEIAG